jgi:hypothetical protein
VHAALEFLRPEATMALVRSFAALSQACAGERCGGGGDLAEAAAHDRGVSDFGLTNAVGVALLFKINLSAAVDILPKGVVPAT